MFSIISKIIFVALVFLLINAPNDYLLMPVINGLSQLIGLMVAAKLIYRSGYKISKPSIRIISYCLRFTRGFFLSRLSVAAYMSSATVVLGLVSHPTVVATYSMAEQLYKAMQSAVSAVSVAAYPYMAREKNTSLMFKIIAISVSVAFMGALFGSLISPVLIPKIFGDGWLSSISLLNIFFVAIVVHTASVMMGYPFAAAVGRVEVANKSIILGGYLYGVLLIGLWTFNSIHPVFLATLMIITESSVLLYRSLILVPIALRS